MKMTSYRRRPRENFVKTVKRKAKSAAQASKRNGLK
jgi:hypothetical protein